MTAHHADPVRNDRAHHMDYQEFFVGKEYFLFLMKLVIYVGYTTFL